MNHLISNILVVFLKAFKIILHLGRLSSYILLVIISAVIACKSQQAASGSAQQDKAKQQDDYEDKDLKNFYPGFEKFDFEAYKAKLDTTVPRGHIRKKLSKTFDTIAKKNKKYKYAQGYRIQIYSGSNKSAANEAKVRAYEILPNANVYKDYPKPNYKVRVGDYIDRLEAFQNQEKLLKEFPDALVVPDKINLQRD